MIASGLYLTPNTHEKNEPIQLYVILPTLILITSIFLFLSAPRIEQSDYTLYALAKSMVRDGDFIIDHDPLDRSPGLLQLSDYSPRMLERPIPSVGYPLTYLPFLKWIPTLKAIRLISGNLSVFTQTAGRDDAMGILAGTLFFSIGSMIVLYGFLLSRFTYLIGIWTILFFLLGTPFFYYSCFNPSSPHALISFTFISAFFCMDKSRENNSFSDFLIILSGFFCGWLFVIENSMGLVIVILLISGVAKRCYRVLNPFLSMILRLLLFSIGIVPWILYQLHYNKIQYGSNFNWGFIGRSGISFDPGYSLNILQSIWSLIIWSPLVLLGIWGLVLLIIRERWLPGTCLVMMFFSLIPPLFFPIIREQLFKPYHFYPVWIVCTMLGISELLQRSRRFIPLIIALCVIVSASTTIVAGVIMNAPNSNKNNMNPINNNHVTHIWPMFQTLLMDSPDSMIDVITSGLMDGKIPSVGLNLLSHWSISSTIFITGLSANFSLVDPQNIDGTARVWSRDKNRGQMRIVIWPYVDKDQNYRQSGIMASFDLPIELLKGFHNIHWVFDHQGMLILDIPGYQGKVYISPKEWRPLRETIINLAHIHVEIVSNGIVRVLSYDLERI